MYNPGVRKCGRQDSTVRCATRRFFSPDRIIRLRMQKETESELLESPPCKSYLRFTPGQCCAGLRLSRSTPCCTPSNRILFKCVLSRINYFCSFKKKKKTTYVCVDLSYLWRHIQVGDDVRCPQNTVNYRVGKRYANAP